MRKVTTKETTATPARKRKVISGELTFIIEGKKFTLNLGGRISQSGKTIVFRSTRDAYLENGIGCNVWIDLDLI